VDRDAAFEALGEPVRRRILDVLAGGERPAGAIVAAIQTGTRISQPAVSQHLKVLREAGLITVRAEGTRRLYAIDHTGIRAAQAWLSGLADPLEPFAQPLDALTTEVARGRRRRRAAALDQPSTRPSRRTRPA
jgi:DNA-binding transcriptional ArsR family regulator